MQIVKNTTILFEPLLYGLSWYGRANVRTHFRLCVIFMELLSKEI